MHPDSELQGRNSQETGRKIYIKRLYTQPRLNKDVINIAQNSLLQEVINFPLSKNAKTQTPYKLI
jgi:hypothetical protein